MHGADGQRGRAKFELMVDVSMEKNIIELPKENEGFWRCRLLTDSADMQNLSLEYISIR